MPTYRDYWAAIRERRLRDSDTVKRTMGMYILAKFILKHLLAVYAISTTASFIGFVFVRILESSASAVFTTLKDFLSFRAKATGEGTLSDSVAYPYLGLSAVGYILVSAGYVYGNRGIFKFRDWFGWMVRYFGVVPQPSQINNQPKGDHGLANALKAFLVSILSFLWTALKAVYCPALFILSRAFSFLVVALWYEIAKYIYFWILGFDAPLLQQLKDSPFMTVLNIGTAIIIVCLTADVL
ncbi:hypothetical protein QBC34DRAFT_436729 [Podospora aff. communis PSN243]|uniref:Uncharacterized protein n=1 Tax=Podospora aff. communis PSN243 TaxID=3040156 RepID=A0AAV9GX75_9PEZI|nr:hypothetical protein QBC34DRAFT_436729 [Podospora aff. communis PSN243]